MSQQPNLFTLKPRLKFNQTQAMPTTKIYPHTHNSLSRLISRDPAEVAKASVLRRSSIFTTATTGGDSLSLSLSLSSWSTSTRVRHRYLAKFRVSVLKVSCISVDTALTNQLIQMVFVSVLPANCSGLVHCSPKLPFKDGRHKSTRYNDYNAFQLPSTLIHRARIQCSHPKQQHFGVRYVVSVGRRNHHHQLSFDDDDLSEEPFWISWIKDAFWGLKTLFVFLAEQPNQLKYIEWPGFQSTLKTATLTLALVAVLIVALSTVDSALCYMLALILRRTP